MPRKFFSQLEVLQGGIGTGTIISVTMKAMGLEQQFRMEITEPEPGRVLQEEDVDKEIITRFIIDPNLGSYSNVTIKTIWKTRKGIKGFFEKLINPFVIKKIYKEELGLINDYCSRVDMT